MKRQHKPSGDYQVNKLKPEAQEKKVVPRQPVTKEDMEAYIDRSQHGPCFICEIIAGNPEYYHHIIYQDDTAVVFLNKYPVLYGYTLVAPRQHLEQVTNDFAIDEYLALQGLIYQVSEALRQVVPAERMYILSLGSQQGNKHVHWHIAPLPPGVPYQEQQFEALQSWDKGVLKISNDEMASLAIQIRRAMDKQGDNE